MDGKKQRLTNVEEQMASGDFWNDRQRAEKISIEARLLKDSITSWETLKRQLEDLDELRLMAAEEDEDEETLAELESEGVELAVRSTTSNFAPC